ncbi:MAG: phasin family protein [Myxococcota bacterium]
MFQFREMFEDYARDVAAAQRTALSSMTHVGQSVIESQHKLSRLGVEIAGDAIALAAKQGQVMTHVDEPRELLTQQLSHASEVAKTMENRTREVLDVMSDAATAWGNQVAEVTSAQTKED